MSQKRMRCPQCGDFGLMEDQLTDYCIYCNKRFAKGTFAKERDQVLKSESMEEQLKQLQMKYDNIHQRYKELKELNREMSGVLESYDGYRGSELWEEDVYPSLEWRCRREAVLRKIKPQLPQKKFTAWEVDSKCNPTGKELQIDGKTMRDAANTLRWRVGGKLGIHRKHVNLPNGNRWYLSYNIDPRNNKKPSE